MSLKSVAVLIIVGISALSSGARAETCNKDQIIKLVDQACEMVGKQGDQAYGALAGPEFNGKCDSYVWVHEYKGNEIIVTFHPTNPSMMGKDMSGLKDPAGKPIFGSFKTAAPKKGNTAWIGYKWPKAGSETPQEKCSYVRNCDGKLTAGMGIYADCAGLGLKKFQ